MASPPESETPKAVSDLPILDKANDYYKSPNVTEDARRRESSSDRENEKAQDDTAKSNASDERDRKEKHDDGSFPERHDSEANIKDENKTPIIKNGLDVSKYLVSLRDDGDHSLTFRGIVIGSLLTILSSVITMLYTAKPVEVNVSSYFLILLAWLGGQAWAIFLPQEKWIKNRPRLQWLAPYLRFFNPGPFSLKEHVVCSLIASSGNNGLSCAETFATEKLFYNTKITASAAVFGIFSVSLIGFGLLGLLRPLVVWPSEMVYWGTLPMVSLYQSLHYDPKENPRRLKIFGVTLALTAIWEPIVAYIVPWWNGFSVFCLASINAPSRIRTHFTRIFGGASSNEGLGILSVSLDPQYIQASTYAVLPLKQQISSWVGYFITYVAFLALYYGNAWNAKSLPFLSTSLFNATDGSRYNQTVLFGTSSKLDLDALGTEGLPRLTASNIWNLTTQAIAIGALLTHTLLFWRKDIIIAFKHARNGTQPDPHWVAMKKYKEVPHFWYLICLVLAIAASFIAIYKAHTTLPWWGLILSLLLGAFIAPFSTVLYALFGNGVSTNSLSKMVAGAVHPGAPVANLWFASYSHQVILLVVNLANWQKLGQYLKVPPRVMFVTQVYGTLLGASFNYLVMSLIVSSQKEILIDPIGSTVWSGQTFQSLNSQAVEWALARQVFSFTADGPGYGIVPLGLLIGAVLPVIHWLLSKRWRWLREQGDNINTAVIANFSGSLYSGITSFYTSAIALGVFTQIWLRTRRPKVFNEFAYLISAALDGASQIMVFVLSFAVFGASGKERPFPTWFGNPSGNPDHCMEL